FPFMLLRPPLSTLFPYTTLFRSVVSLLNSSRLDKIPLAYHPANMTVLIPKESRFLPEILFPVFKLPEEQTAGLLKSDVYNCFINQVKRQEFENETYNV